MKSTPTLKLTVRLGIILTVLGLAIALAVIYAAISWFGRPSPIRIAFANSFTGTNSYAGPESLVATRLYLDEVNRHGGIKGHPIELVIFDDASSTKTGRDNVQAIADSPCVGVLGHYVSTVSVAAGPGYKAARIPALNRYVVRRRTYHRQSLLFPSTDSKLCSRTLDRRICRACIENTQGQCRGRE